MKPFKKTWEKTVLRLRIKFKIINLYYKASLMFLQYKLNLAKSNGMKNINT